MSRVCQINSHGVYVPPLGPDALVVDLGAHRGDFSREIDTQFGCRCVMAEANPELVVEARDVGEAHAVAIAGSTGPRSFHLSKDMEGSSLLDLPGASVYGVALEETIRVPAVTLGDFLERHAEPVVDLLKVDIEGAEVEVFDTTADDVLLAMRQITVEFHDDPVFGYDLRGGVRRVLARLKRLGFLCLNFERPRTVNVLFLGPALRLASIEKVGLKLAYDTLPYARRQARRAVRRYVLGR